MRSLWGTSCVLALRTATASVAMIGLVGIASAAGLEGTSWQLVEIQSMNDTVDRPDNPSKYMLEFLPEGRVAIRADCNRGTGSWTSDLVGQLGFGPIASTRAMCPPGSLSESYLAQFEWVRSYVIENEHLFLATMADGSIIEFEPAGEIAARVLGDEIRAGDGRQLQSQILTRLFDRYAADEGLNANSDEIDTLVARMSRDMAEEGLEADEDLTGEEVEQAASMRRQMARSMIRQWKVNKALYAEYGGRIIYQQLGPEPLDTYRQFLAEAAGDFAILDKSLEDEFWRYFKDESKHDFMKPGSDDEKQAFGLPPWEPRY